MYRDPVHDGATDPTLIRHRATGEWWMFYTARRPDLECDGAEWVHGTDIGVATSADGGRSWTYRGTAEGLEFEPGRNTYWAPEVLWHDGTYHMFVSYLSGVRSDWSGDAQILHYTSQDLAGWDFASVLDLGSERVIDAAVYALPGGGWRLWFKDERDGSRIHAADSPDLYSWKRLPGPAAAGDQPQEGPSVFRLAGSYWMVTDNWSGLSVYRSHDLDSWSREPYQLLAPHGHHAMAVEQGDDEALLVYFTHVGDEHDRHAGEERRSVVRATPLAVRDGRLFCAPDAAADAAFAPLRAELTPPLRGGKRPGDRTG